jgi:septum formation protein
MLQDPDIRFVLASGSAARRELLKSAGIDFAVVVAAIDEAAVKHAAQASGESAAEAALTLARMKASRVALREPEALIIAADQILVCGDMWFDKPLDKAHAREQLITLCGRTHSLATAVVCQCGDRQV